MRVIAVHPHPERLAALVDCVRAIHPDCQIWPFNDPMLAVKHGYNNPADAVYTLIDMPRISGFDVARLLRKQNPQLLVNFVAPDDGSKQDALRFGANSYTAEPLTPQRLRAAETEEW